MDNAVTVNVSDAQIFLSLLIQMWLIIFPIIIIKKLNNLTALIQEQFDSEEVLSHENKLKIIDQVMEYFYNFWKLIETSKDTKLYTMYFNINLVMINVPMTYYIKIKNLLESLKNVIRSNVKESYFIVENKLAKYFFDIRP